jgi:hypothetical protein
MIIMDNAVDMGQPAYTRIMIEINQEGMQVISRKR